MLEAIERITLNNFLNEQSVFRETNQDDCIKNHKKVHIIRRTKQSYKKNQIFVQKNSIKCTYHRISLYEYLFISISIWRASSLVGVKTSALGPFLSLRGLK